MSYDWLTVTRATITQSQLMLVTKTIPETQVPKAGASSVSLKFVECQTNESNCLKNYKIVLSYLKIK